MFQSLAGFLARCDLVDELLNFKVKIVSIPGGFSRSLRLRRRWCYGTGWYGFNPWRVFSLVATLRPGGGLNGSDSFNPWRVFSLVATVAAWFLRQCTFRCFNPWRVFSLVATVVSIFNIFPPIIVSIPGGFSRSLRRITGESDANYKLRFNPWRVFSLVATSQMEAYIHEDFEFQSLAGFLARCDPSNALPSEVHVS